MNTILIIIVAYLLIFVVAVLVASRYTKLLDQAARQWQSCVAIPLQELHEYVCIPVVLMEDAPLHTDERPRCDDPSCPCRADSIA